MKGIVFNLLEEVISRHHGEETWEQLLQAAGDDGVYTSLGSYSDERIAALVREASKALGIAPGDVLRWFGRQSMPLLAARYPAFFTGPANTRSFLLTLNDIIHPEVRKLYPGAYVPVFDFDSSSPDVLFMGYQSDRKLCALAHGFIEGAADHYQEEASVEQPQCMHDGAPRCLFELRFHRSA
jgi:hypothetical protein